MNMNISRLENTFFRLNESNLKALIPFVTTGDPCGVDVSDLMHALVSGGADVVELGIPFSDPAADGEIIQKAGERALANGVSFHHTLSAVQKFRLKDAHTPVILMGYLNSAEIFPGGFSGFSQAVNSSGADAVILVDLSYESGSNYRKSLKAAKVDLISLVAPTTSKTRLGKMLKNARGFVYYVSMRGVTGNAANGELDAEEISSAIQQIREKTSLPVCVGFGIKDGETAKSIAKHADGVVVGSALVKILHDTQQSKGDVLAAASEYMATLRKAIDN